MKSRRQPPAPSNTPAISGPEGGCFAAEGRTWPTICPKAPKSWLPVQVAGSLPEEIQRRIARSSAFFGGVGRTLLAAWVPAAFAWLTAGDGLLGPFIIVSAACLSVWRRACVRRFAAALAFSV